MNLPDSAILNNLYVPGSTRPDLIFEKRYIECRTKEKRMYTDEEVSRLPACPTAHPHYSEWIIRKASCRKLYAYMSDKKKPLQILEIGCGNGWLLHQLSNISRTSLTGLDINFTELQQAARIFSGCRKMKFVYGDIYSGILGEKKFDIILFAASMQYFGSFDEIVELCLQHLNPDGEIHIMDTRFYQTKDIASAKKRSSDHYRSLGYPEMARYYFHHPLSVLGPFNHTVLYDPGSFFNRFTRNRVPFHWVRIKNDPS